MNNKRESFPADFILESILNHTQNPIVVIDSNHQVVCFNYALKEVQYGYHGRLIKVGEDYREFIVEGTSEEYYLYWDKALHGESNELELKTANGNMERWFVWKMSPVHDYNKKVTAVMLTAIDVTDKKREEIKQLEALEKLKIERLKSFEMQSKLLSSQLNPHFIYNTLNAFQYYILEGNIKDSLNHISDFANLMRKVLENSMKNVIPLNEEIDFIKHYIRVSQSRMKDDLDFIFSVDNKINIHEFMIPPMLFQPYIENAIIHGLNNLQVRPKLTIKISLTEDLVNCVIQDNGVGRVQSKKNKKHQKDHKSFAMRISNERLNILSELLNNQFFCEITDLIDKNGNAKGTKVRIQFKQIFSNSA